MSYCPKILQWTITKATEYGFLTPVQKHEVDFGQCLIWICFINLFFIRWRRLKSKLQFLNHILNKGELLYLKDICLAKLYFPILSCSMCSKHMYYKLCSVVGSKWKTKWLKHIPKLKCTHSHFWPDKEQARWNCLCIWLCF